VQDLEDDALVGVKSSARRLGSRVREAVLGFYIVAFVLAVAAAWRGGLGPLFLPLAGLYAVHLSVQASRVDIADPAKALRLFKSNAVAGLLLFAALAAGQWRPMGF
jgi:4-hydroxybenzoate polyprenyltransferase